MKDTEEVARPRGTTAHEQLARRFLSAFNHQDAVAVTAYLTDQATLHIPGSHQLAGTFTGRAAVMTHLRLLWRQPHSVWRILACEDWLVSDQRILAIVTMHVQLPGRRRDWRRCLLFDVHPATAQAPHDLRIAHVRIFEDDDQTLIDAFIDRSWLS